MAARVFVHPRCWEGVWFGALSSALEAKLPHPETLRIGPLTARGHRELVREVTTGPAGTMYERMDGSSFYHTTGQVAPEPGVA